MSAYYNEHDPGAAAWLRELIADGQIAAGDVDERSIADVQPGDLAGYTQCHFFAGIGGWSLALRLAGWPDDRPVWTGSCPCQPFSGAGKNKGGGDDRHLWPHWAKLIRECRPVTVFGEQVESAIAHGWLDAVFDDLEGAGYSCGAACLPAASVGAPHIRQRIWFVAEAIQLADTTLPSPTRLRGVGGPTQATRVQLPARPDDSCCGVGDSHGTGYEGGTVEALQRAGRGEEGPTTGQPSGSLRRCEFCGYEFPDSLGRYGCPNCLGEGLEEGRMADTSSEGAARHAREDGRERGASGIESDDRSPWRDLVWLNCRDGKSRPTQSGIFPLAHGLPNRVVRLRGYGNAIVPQVAAEMIRAYMDITEAA